MSSVENLFAIEPTLPNVQTHKLPDNPERWTEVITTALREQYPDAAKLPIEVEYRKKDERTGTAIGALNVTSEEAKKSLLVPFIIRKFELSPLDIWMEPKSQAVHPMTKDTFKEVFFVQSPAEGLDARPTDSAGTYFNDPSMWTSTYPPLQGRYSYASGGYTLLDLCSDSFTKEDADTFRATLQANPHLILKFQKHGHGEVIEKLAKKTYAPLSNDYAAAAMKLIPTAAANVKKEDTDKYSILSIAEGLFDTIQVQKLDRVECAKFLAKITGSPQDVLNEVDEEGEKMLVTRKPAPGVWLYDLDMAGPEEAKDFATYRVKTKTGLQLDGVVIPYVVDFTGKKKNYKLFLSPNHAAFQGSIAGIRMVGVDDKPIMQKILKPADIRVGQTGTFVYIDDGKAIATEPVTIKAVESYGPLSVCDLNGKRFNVRRGYGEYFTKEEKEAGLGQPVSAAGMKGMKQEPKKTYLDAHGFLEVRKDVFVIPEKMLWIPMEGFSDVSATPAEWIQKEAAAHMEIDPLVVQWTGVNFEISGAGLPKLAMSRPETKLLLAAAGVGTDKIAAVMGKLKHTGKVKIHGTDRLRPKAAKAGEVGTMISKVASAAQSLRVNLIKEAAEIDDKATVDALLGLNFLNADNLAKFVAYKPVLDKVLDYLAELTLASRLGQKDVPETAAVTAMHKLMEVSDGLQKIQVSMKRPSTKTAAAKATPVVKGKKYLPNGKAKLIAAIGG